MILAYSGLTFRTGKRWAIGIRRFTWDSKSLVSMLITFLMVVVMGYVGSTIVLVPGAQTFESLKDLSVFLCIVLFGYPALIMVPFAYGVADLIEGVPADFLRDWLVGYFINPACFWIAYQIIGRNPDFRKARTWAWYFLFVIIFMTIEPFLWGYICSGKFTEEISYRNITPALIFTTSITWILAPLATLIAYPLVRRLKLFWAEIPSHAKERALGSSEWQWIDNHQQDQSSLKELSYSIPVRLAVVTPFVFLIVTMVVATAYFTLSSAEENAKKLARRLHDEIAANINMKLDDYLDEINRRHQKISNNDLHRLLTQTALAGHGIAVIVTRDAEVLASSDTPIATRLSDEVVSSLKTHFSDLSDLRTQYQFDFKIISAKPLSHENWFAQASPYFERTKMKWILVTAMPEAYYLNGVRSGNSRAAFVFSVALVLSLLTAILISQVVAEPILKISKATKDLAEGDLSSRVPSSRLEELNLLSIAFNNMAHRLQHLFDDLFKEVNTRKTRELELEQSQIKIREGESRLQMAIKGADLGIWDWDILNNRISWDGSMFRQYGIPKENFCGLPEEWFNCLHPDDREKARQEVAAALHDDKDYDLEFRVCHSDGQVRYIKGIGQTFRDKDGNPIRMVGINYDITDRKLAEIELRRSRDEALRLSDSKSEFLANMSHEIRSPLNAILGVAEVLNETNLDIDQTKLLRVLRKSGAHLLSLINDILDLASLEAKGYTLQLKPFDLHEMANSCCDFMMPQAISKSIGLSLKIGSDVPRFVLGDPQRLRQILINLLSNAVKFTDEGSVCLKVSRKNEDSRPGSITISVSDTGIGISPEKLGLIFERFVQGDSSPNKKYAGSGLGLSISKHLLELMGETIHVESTLGKGSKFYFDLHLDVDNPEKAKPIPKPVYLENRVKILVVDDSEDNLMLMQLFLNQDNFDVHTASNGEEAVEKFKNEKFQIIFMDIQMPKMDGHSATRAIRLLEEQGNLEHTPIIALTAYVLKDDQEKSYAAGCDLHVSKPIAKRALFDLIAKLTRKNRSNKFDTRNPDPKVKDESLPL